MYNFGIMLTRINLIGVLQEVTILGLVDLFDSIDSGEDMDSCQHPSQIWSLILADHWPILQNLVLKKVHHPAIRIWIKFTAFTMTAKS